jgi:hypothetical protein|tara:strand:- start:438 stop:995 length:558 start_codon:yes stop_codon:yes gene_type:complete
MPCSQCGKSGHNVRTCQEWLHLIHFDLFESKKVEKKILYHGTSLESALNIQKHGFSTNIHGKNGRMLGNGVYATSSIDKAQLYANGFHKSNLYKGVILKLSVETGKCCTLKKNTDVNRKEWITKGFDSCYLPPNIMGRKGKDLMFDEYCIKDTRKIKVVDVIICNSSKLYEYGYMKKKNRLCKIN